MPKYEYITQQSDLLGEVKRPLIAIEFFSRAKNLWITIQKVLTDTGADVSILPKYIGEMLVTDITNGRFYRIRGVVPYSFLDCWIHKLKLRIEKKEFEQQVAIADSDDVPAVLGRVNGLDLFHAEFVKGKELVLHE